MLSIKGRFFAINSGKIYTNFNGQAVCIPTHLEIEFGFLGQYVKAGNALTYYTDKPRSVGPLVPGCVHQSV